MFRIITGNGNSVSYRSYPSCGCGGDGGWEKRTIDEWDGKRSKNKRRTQAAESGFHRGRLWDNGTSFLWVNYMMWQDSQSVCADTGDIDTMNGEGARVGESECIHRWCRQRRAGANPFIHRPWRRLWKLVLLQMTCGGVKNPSVNTLCAYVFIFGTSQYIFLYIHSHTLSTKDNEGTLYRETW